MRFSVVSYGRKRTIHSDGTLRSLFILNCDSEHGHAFHSEMEAIGHEVTLVASGDDGLDRFWDGPDGCDVLFFDVLVAGASLP
ncbi:hypothetical protein GCM10011415_34370 [Salipiger pallidus]|uniref:Uncharacterized protein n=1 Tax=Salipiger pallidus TaxID=1775170 RepID=A0A8J3EH99_9RHOB|nr:hypothetical protein GCM10011415_34370 [Salipiger pallidus]